MTGFCQIPLEAIYRAYTAQSSSFFRKPSWHLKCKYEPVNGESLNSEPVNGETLRDPKSQHTPGGVRFVYGLLFTIWTIGNYFRNFFGK